MNRRNISCVLRLALAFAFLYSPIAAFFYPDNWIWFVPDFVGTFVPKLLFMQVFGVVEILIALGVLFLKNPTIPAILACLILAGIIVLDWSAFDATFRDVSILLAGVGLIILHQKKDNMVA